MKKNKLVNVIIVFLAIVLFTSVSMAIVEMYDSKADTSNEFNYKLSAEISDEYIRDSFFNVPTLIVQYKGNEYITSSKLFYPDNRESENASNYLDVEGEYTLRYSFSIKGVSYTKDYTFNVFAGISSLFSSSKATVSVNEKAPYYMNLDRNYTGVKVSTKFNRTVVEYSQPIDLSDNTRDDVLIEFLAIPSSINIAESTSFIIQLVDTEDPENFVKIRVCHHASSDYYQAFVGANFKYGFAGSDPYNMLGYNPGNIYSGNGGLTAGFVMRNASTKICANSYGYCKDYTLSSVKLYFDYYERSVYAKPTALTNAVGDLDDVSQVGEGNQWNGFNADKAYLSIQTNLTSSQAEYLILNVDGQSMSQYKVEDDSAPEIKIDYKGNSEDNLPYGLVGKSYDIFNATVIDNLDNISYLPNVRVYNKTSYKNLEIDNGKFIPKEQGEYVIQYTAEDFHGNVSTKELIVQVKENYDEPISYKFNDEQDSNVLVGELFTVLDGNAQGGSGKLSVKYSLFKDNQAIVDNIISYKFNQTGEFVLRAVVTDYLGETQSFDKIFVVESNLYPMFEMPFIAEQFIAGNSYYLPSVKAYDYSSVLDGEIVAVDVYANGVKLTDNCFKPTESGNVLITYKAVSKHDSIKYTEYTKTVEVIKPVGATFISDYFYCSENVTKTVNSDNVSFAMNTQEMISFINFVGVDGFNIDFNVNANKNNFEKISFYLIDANNPSLKVKISVGKADNTASKTSKVYINDVYVSTISGSFFGNVVNSFIMNFKQTDAGFGFYDGTTGLLVGRVETTVDGKPFTTFESDSVYFKFELEGVTGNSELILYSICNQMFNKAQGTDKTAPFIVLNGDIEKDKSVGFGQTVVLPSAKAFDLLTVNPILNLIIVDPDGVTIYDGSALESYSFVATKYGTYSINYYAKDSSLKGNTATLPYSCKVINNVAPTIDVDQTKIPTSVYVGARYTLPKVTIKDNYGNSVYSSIIIYSPNGTCKRVTNNTFTLTEKGIHKLVYFACDEQGNYTMKTFIISAI